MYFDLENVEKRLYTWVELMGWHNKSNLEYLALVASEVGEAVNECRGDLVTDNFGEELADIMLRVIDLANVNGIDIGKAIMLKLAKNETMTEKPYGRNK